MSTPNPKKPEAAGGGKQPTEQANQTNVAHDTEQHGVTNNLRTSLQDLLLTVSSNFITATPEEVDGVIEQSLASICKHLGASYGYLYRYNRNTQHIIRENFASLTPHVSNQTIWDIASWSNLDDWVSKHHQHLASQYNHTHPTPDNPTLRALLNEIQIATSISIPLLDNEGCTGFVGFDSVDKPCPQLVQCTDLLYVYAKLLARVRERAQREIKSIETARLAKVDEEKHKFLFENTIQGVVFQNANGEIIYANKAAEEILGLSLEQMNGLSSIDPLWHSIHEDGTEFRGSEHPAMESLKTGLPVKDAVMGVFNPQKNSYTWININSFPRFKPNSPEPYEVVATFEDITLIRSSTIEMNKAIKQAAVNNANITAIIENTTENIWAINTNYEIIYTNRIFKQEFLNGFDVDLCQGMNIVEALPAVLRPLWKSRYDKALANQRHVFEDAIDVDSFTIYVQVAMNPIAVDGHVIGASCFARNITDQKKAERELITAKEKAEESDRLKSAFLANMSHEIRTPMNSILGFADLLKSPDLTGDSQQEYIHIIEKSGTRMLNIINDIVDISKIESGLMETHYTDSNINEQIEYIYQFLKPEAHQKGLKISFHAPMPDNESVVVTDREKLYAVLTNLVKNAIKYTKTGSIVFGYRPIASKHNKPFELEFFVADTGIGIPANRHEAIFDRFVQADIEDRQAMQGAGLGLAISKSYIEMLGGKIWVESEEHHGSTFKFTIPYQTRETANHSADNVTHHIDIHINHLTILIAEDEDDSSKLLDITLKHIAKQIFKAKTGEEAVEICRSNPHIDLVLMDIKMPGMNGYEATRQIREFNKNAVIIAQTAYGLTGDRELAIETGCNDYIAKPLNTNQLFHTIKKHFN